jgi:hypothetical protein
MGLTIHYRLSWPAKGVTDAAQAVERLRQRCLDLPFKEVGPVQTFEGGACDYQRHQHDDDVRWFLIQSQGHIGCVADVGGRYRPVRDDERWSCSIDAVPIMVIGFSAWPGEGCEQSNFGLRLLPPRVRLHTRRNESYWLPIAERDQGWTWSSFCKTQYANDPRCGGLQHFLLCHLTVVGALDAALQLGFAVEVSDEGRFWENRSVEALAKEIGAWDQHLAALEGLLKDQAAAQGITLAAPITERPDFEHLEAAGSVDPALVKVIETVTRTAAEQASSTTQK